MRLYGGSTGNFHNNFIDLNPSWANARHDNAVKEAGSIMDKIRKQVGREVENKGLE